MEGIVGCEDLLQLTQAMTTQIILQINANKGEGPPGRTARYAAGMKMTPIASQATVMVYSRPVDFR